jgi:GrpB-like predicted nucleotidyltransferase (UPF0157 family)
MELNTIQIVEHNPNWEKHFFLEADAIHNAIEDVKIYIDHVGSTSVKGMPSKPIVDILVSTPDWNSVEAVVEALTKIGYHINEKCDETPRYFLVKYLPNNETSFHVHVCEPERRWAREMLIFKDELSRNDQLAKDYASLKFALASKHKNNVQAYIVGKRNFIENGLRTNQSEFSINKLLAGQRAESNEAEQLQVKMIISQLFISLIAAVSVYSNDNKYLFAAAAIGFFLVLLWFRFSQKQQRHRAAGDQARRAALLISGLGKEPSPRQKLRIINSFGVKKGELPGRREEDHFASRELPGYKRLTEMIEESSYWTSDLQRYSGGVMGMIMLAAALLILAAFGAAIASLDSDTLVSLSRVILAIMVFIVSSDWLGLMLAYKTSAVTIDEIFKRVEIVAARGFKDADVLLLMADYNAAIERAPTPLPGVFQIREKDLGQRWRAYIEEKLTTG